MSIYYEYKYEKESELKKKASRIILLARAKGLYSNLKKYSGLGWYVSIKDDFWFLGQEVISVRLGSLLIDEKPRIRVYERGYDDLAKAIQEILKEGTEMEK